MTTNARNIDDSTAAELELEAATALTDEQAAGFLAETLARVDRTVPSDPAHARLFRVVSLLGVGATIELSTWVGPSNGHAQRTQTVTVTDVTRHRLHVASGRTSASIPWASVRSITVLGSVAVAEAAERAALTDETTIR